jgi:hypothetical protein
MAMAPGDIVGACDVVDALTDDAGAVTDIADAL